MAEINPYEAPESAKDENTDLNDYFSKIEFFHQVKDLRLLSNITKVVLSLYILLALTFLAFAIIAHQVSLDTLIELDTVWAKVASFYSISFYLSMLFVAIWQVESMKNSHIILMTENLPHNSPIMSVIMYFMPIVCWWVPFQAVKEICVNSMKQEFVPYSWLRFWWAAWLVGFFTGFGGLGDFDQYTNLEGSLVDLSLSILAMIAAATSLTIIISRVTLHQYKLHEKHGNEVV